ncbi:MAG: response regulator transcription factor [Sandaracinus sp.]|nr:response regulator transcription factor [Sandaracinus sp.]MCB9637228.1 response regulator transcription factor [Sandaracinus sp.]
MRHVLIADDEARIREVVRYALEKEGYRVTEVSDGRSAVDVARREAVDLVVLDVMMPGIDGLEVCRRLKAETRAAVLFLSARSDELDRVLGLELGGDDYLTKPFSPRELVARVKAVLRRGEDTRDVVRVLSHGPVRIDPQRHEVRCHDELVKLTATELGVLRALYERPGVVLSRAQLMERAYSYDNLVTERTLDTHVRRIRAKFRAHDFDPILTVHGVGYRAPDL